MAGPGRALWRKLRRLRRRPAFVRLWLLPVWLLLGLARAVIVLLPFRRLAPWLGRPATGDGGPWIPLATPRQEARAQLIGETVRLAARYSPWTANCFPQAVVARLLLGLYGLPHGVYFGLRPPGQRSGGNGVITAHAWVACGRVAVAGGRSFARFPVVAMFVPRRLASKGPPQVSG